MGVAREQDEPPRGGDRGHEGGRGRQPGDRGERATDQDREEERDWRDRQRDLLDEERDRDEDASGDRPGDRVPPDGVHPDGEIAEDEERDRDVETRGPGEVLEVRCGEVGHDGQRPDERPDPGAEPADEEQDADARDDVEELAPRERIDPEPDVGSREKDRPERRMRGEHRAEHRPRPVPGEHAVADPQVLRLVERAEVRTGKEDQADEDRDGGPDHLPGHAALRPRSDSHRTMLIGKSAGAADPLGTEYGRPGR